MIRRINILLTVQVYHDFWLPRLPSLWFLQFRSSVQALCTILEEQQFDKLHIGIQSYYGASWFVFKRDKPIQFSRLVFFKAFSKLTYFLKTISSLYFVPH